MTQWKRGGNQERLVLSFFSTHDEGSVHEIYAYLKDSPSAWNIRRFQLPTKGRINSILKANHWGVRKESQKEGTPNCGTRKTNVFYRPPGVKKSDLAVTVTMRSKRSLWNNMSDVHRYHAVISHYPSVSHEYAKILCKYRYERVLEILGSDVI